MQLTDVSIRLEKWWAEPDAWSRKVGTGFRIRSHRWRVSFRSRPCV